MNPGKITCEVLKKIRSEIAEANQIDYRSEPCSFKGECLGTCPKCESELQYLEHQLIKKQGSQKTALFAGVSLAIMSGLSACKQSDPAVQNTQTPSVKPQTEAVKNIKLSDELIHVNKSQKLKSVSKPLKQITDTIQLINIDTNKTIITKIIETDERCVDTSYLNKKNIRNFTTSYNEGYGLMGAIEMLPALNPFSKIVYQFKPLPINHSSAPFYFTKREKFENYLNSLFTYPFNKTLNKKIIKLQILIDKSGKIKDVSVLKSIDQEIDQKILEIFKKMAQWTPGKDPKGTFTDTRVKLTLKVTPEKITVVRQTYDEVEITIN